MRAKDLLERGQQALAATQKGSQTLEVPREPVGFVGKELAKSNARLLAEIEELEACLRREAEAAESVIEAARIGRDWNNRRALLEAELHRVRADAARALLCGDDNQEKSMTTPVERTRSLLQAAAFLKELASDSSLPPAVRQEASRLLRHYPTVSTVHLLATMEAKHFGSNLLSSEVAERDVLPPSAH